MSIWAITSLINCITSVFVGVLVYARNRHKRVNITYSLFCLSLTIWSFAYFLWQISDNSVTALLWCRILIAGATFIPICYLHHFLIFIRQDIKKKNIITFSYVFGFLSLAANLTPYFIKGVSPKMWFAFWPNAGILFYPFLAVWFALSIYVICVMACVFVRSRGVFREQLKYILIGKIIGLVGGATNFPLWFDINIPPVGNIVASVYMLIITYAIFKYKLLDIKIAVSRIGIFAAIYALIPFAIGAKLIGFGLWLVPTGASFILAIIGPKLFAYFRQKSENHILKEERQMQTVLSETSDNLISLQEFPKLLTVMTDTLRETLHVNHIAVYLLNKENNDEYLLKKSHPRFNKTKSIKVNDCFTTQLKKDNEILVRDDIKSELSIVVDNGQLKNILSEMIELSADGVIPCILGDQLYGFIVIGKSERKKLYSNVLTRSLRTFGRQSALAIKNCHYIDDKKKYLQEECQKSRRQALDHMAGSMAHEINNPLQIILGAVDYFEQLEHDPRIPKDIRGKFKESIDLSTDAVKRIAEMIQAIVKYSNLESDQTKSFSIPDALKEYSILIQKQIQKEKVSFTKQIEYDLPKVSGDSVLFQEVLINLTINALHAVRNNEEKNLYLRIFIKNENIARIEFIDNGHGIENKLIDDIFLPSVTTKGSDEAEGLGLYRVRKIVETFQGKVWAQSKGKGSVFIIELPVYKEALTKQ